jgi:hypothetical protein
MAASKFQAEPNNICASILFLEQLGNSMDFSPRSGTIVLETSRHDVSRKSQADNDPKHLIGRIQPDLIDLLKRFQEFLL